MEITTEYGPMEFHYADEHESPLFASFMKHLMQTLAPDYKVAIYHVYKDGVIGLCYFYLTTEEYEEVAGELLVIEMATISPDLVTWDTTDGIEYTVV